MRSYIMRRVLGLIITLLGITVLVFVMMRIVPGDPALAILGAEASTAEVQNLRRLLGTDRPWPEQYVAFLSGLVRGDLGTGLVNREPVVDLIAARLPATLEIAVLGMLIGASISVPIGVLSAVRQYSWMDHLGRVLALMGTSMPVFLFGILLILGLSVSLNLLPSFGRGADLVESLVDLFRTGSAKKLSDSVQRLILPSLTLAAPLVAVNMRLVRSSMLEVLRQDFVTTARSKGLAERRVIFKHGLRNALIPVLTMVGMQLGVLLGGSFIIENMFAWPGLGRLTVTGIHQRDYPVVQGVVLVMAFIMSILNLVVDMLYVLVDPRIRYD